MPTSIAQGYTIRAINEEINWTHDHYKALKVSQVINTQKCCVVKDARPTQLNKSCFDWK